MTRRRLIVPIAAALVGGLLFTLAIRSVGWTAVVNGINRVGWGLVPILALAGLRFVLRAAAWRLCMPPHARLTLGQAFAAFLSGDAVGNVTPLGLLASEPTKVFLIRHRLATREAASSLAVDFVIYSMSAVTMIVVGLTVLLADRAAQSRLARDCDRVAARARRRDLWGVVGWLLARGRPTVGRGPVARATGDVPGVGARVCRQSPRATVARLSARSRVSGRCGDGGVPDAAMAAAGAANRSPKRSCSARSIAPIIIAFKFVPFRLGIDECLRWRDGGVAVGGRRQPAWLWP